MLAQGDGVGGKGVFSEVATGGCRVGAKPGLATVAAALGATVIVVAAISAISSLLVSVFHQGIRIAGSVMVPGRVGTIPMV